MGLGGGQMLSVLNDVDTDQLTHSASHPFGEMESLLASNPESSSSQPSRLHARIGFSYGTSHRD